jgi:DNA gyrase subunit B
MWHSIAIASPGQPAELLTFDRSGSIDRAAADSPPSANARRHGVSVDPSSNIRILTGVEAIRLRPAMFIGGTNLSGLHGLVRELLDNSIDEAIAGFAHFIHVIIHDDGSLSVADDGRGIPVAIHADSGRSALEVVMTELDTGGKFDLQSYRIADLPRGVGLTVVNALSEWLNAEIRRDANLWRQEFRNGRPTTPIHSVGPVETTGTKIRFLPDATIFPGLSFDADVLEKELRDLADWNEAVNIRLTDERAPHSRDVEFRAD